MNGISACGSDWINKPDRNKSRPSILTMHLSLSLSPSPSSPVLPHPLICPTTVICRTSSKQWKSHHPTMTPATTTTVTVAAFDRRTRRYTHLAVGRPRAMRMMAGAMGMRGLATRARRVGGGGGRSPRNRGTGGVEEMGGKRRRAERRSTLLDLTM